VSDPEPVGRAEALGVVDPMRLPIPSWLATWWRRLPMTGRIFVGFAALDVIARLLGLIEPTVHVDPTYPTSLVAWLLPRDLLILLPALVLGRRPDAETATPLVLRGAILLAVVELVGPQLNFYLGFAPSDAMTIGTLVGATTAVVQAVGWVLLAAGLAAFVPPRPSRTIGGYANLAAGAIALWTLMQIDPDLQSPLTPFANLIAVAAGLAWAFLAWVVIRGSADPRRPLAATRLAVAAIAIVASLAAIDVIVSGAYIVRATFGLTFIPSLVVGDVVQVSFAASVLGWFGVGLPTSMLVAAFALGLADSSANAPVATPEDEPPAGPQWPSFDPEPIGQEDRPA
jgi:hypothetical protein